ncbi:MAG: DUF4835 family protein [Bacteroidia bacterium]|nr:DUF4835 family protein [Bacteroidia bacterium]
MKKILLVLLILSAKSFLSFSQEFNCTISVLTGQIQTSDKKIFETLQKDLYEFINNRHWTSDKYQLQERIECSMMINITNRVSTDEFEGTFQIQSRRPVYSTSYYSPLFNYIDRDFSFRYVEFQPLEFNESQFLNNLTSVVAYYAYIVLGLDYDSFSPQGGTPYYLKAQNIVSNAQNVQEKGWKAFEGTQNRYWLMEELLNPQFTPLRDCMYDYHRKGFDTMSEKLVPARGEILTALKKLRKVNQDKPGSFTLSIFFLAKADEIINIFSQANPDEKAQVVNLLSEIDPANSNKYQMIMAGGGGK